MRALMRKAIKGLRVAADVLGRMATDARLVRGDFTDLPDGSGEQWCDAEVLRILRRRSLAALRAQIEPVGTSAYARLLPAWQQVGGAAGIDGLASVIEQLAGTALPASTLGPDSCELGRCMLHGAPAARGVLSG